MRFLFFLLVLPSFCFSQTQFSSVVSNKKNGFRILYENDFFSESDYYYTQGVRMYWQSSFVKKSLVNKVLLSFNDKDKIAGVYIVHEGFTPTSIRRDTILKSDRPFAGLLYFGEYSRSIDYSRKLILTSELIFGVIGPFARGKETQQKIHELINNIAPLGWQNQIRNAFLLNYFLSIEKVLLEKEFGSIQAAALSSFGTYKDDLGIEVSSDIGRKKAVFSEKKSNFQYYLTAKARARYVFYNAALQGVFYQNSNPFVLESESLNKLVYSSNIGITIAYKNIEASYSKNWMTKEFETGRNHAWGTIDLKFLVH